MNTTITLSDHTYGLLARQAEKTNRSVNDVAEEALEQYLLPPHPYIEKVKNTSGWRVVLKGTRIPVSIIVGYLHTGETPETLAHEVIPNVSLAAIYDALSYYHDHKEEIERELAESTEETSKKYLRERLGEEGFARITGQHK
ncbi:MAG: DUF433 domain-containing protein [Chloroflexi bacterium]|nr:DUF433 domain-containing protein [Chloroflexota bacterium]